MRLDRLSLTLLFTFGVFAGSVTLAADATLKSGIDRGGFDTSVKPGDNFFEHVNGTWIKENPIPPEYSKWGSFPKLRDDNLIALHKILDELTSTDEKKQLSDERRKLRDFYEVAMDEKKIDELGSNPLDADLTKIADVKSKEDLVKEVARLRAKGISTLFDFSVSQDEKQSERYAVHIDQGGMGLPERGYYVESTPDSKRIRAAYEKHIAKMLALLGDEKDAAAAGAKTILEIETKLAEASRKPEELRDREKNYNKVSLKELESDTPNLNWDQYLTLLDVKGVNYVIVGQPEFFKRVNELLGSVPAKDWRTYLRWHLVSSMAPYLSRPFETENFNFYSGELRGVKEMQPRWKRVVGVIDGEIGEALGKIYVEKHFPPAAKKRMDDLVKNLMVAYRERISSRKWMGDGTKEKAFEKLAAILPKIGYPSKWREYDDLEVKTDSYAANVMRAEAFESRYRLSRLGKPVDRLEWHMTPPTVNAYYNSSMNEIVFPAGILQPPFFDMNADDAVNYGGIGAVIGHEISHGFDDQGSRSDARGNLVNWWAESDRTRFKELTGKLVKQYSDCTVLDDVHLNGELTLGENIADLGGVMISHAAYQKSLAGKEAPMIDGFTGAQRFFIGFAQVWRGSMTDKELRFMIRTNPHSPGEFRTLVPLSNVEAFYEAFDVKPGQKWYRKPAERVEVW